MGIPAFYRWLMGKYPLSVIDVRQEDTKSVNGVSVPIDSSRPNPNGVEFDNFYLDMNGIIHPCFHPEDQPSPETYDEVFKSVFKYIDHLFSIVRPRKLLFMSIDGVAPRAKMNQQRARRFRAAKESADAAVELEKLQSGSQLETESKERSNLDSNVITPGTEFMAALSSALKYYIHMRLNSDPGWKGVKIILSDANVLGEGEHKVASFIRLQRNLPGFDPNTRHCLYGLDADLIMLALATHEIHFSILREDVRMAQKNGRAINFAKNAKANCNKENKSKTEISNGITTKRFQFLNIWVLREYLSRDLKIPDPVVKIDLERLIDDFVFICLFVGNDFLPHIPSLEINEGAIDLLMAVYCKEFNTLGGYLTESIKVDFARVDHFLQIVGSYEVAIFKKRYQIQKERAVHLGTVSDPKKGNRTSDFRSCSNIPTSTSSNDGKPGITIDQVKLGEEGWKERYYAEKLESSSVHDQEKIKRHMVKKYFEGICWVMHYYYEGVCSWQWFYPYHYAPFASDFTDLKHLKMHFKLGIPFRPFEQLMGVLPSASAHALPLFYRKLMIDPSSSIADFYPTDFELDLNGKRFSWQAVCKLPFIEESRLLAEIEKVEHTLTEEEKLRNSWALDMLFVHVSHPLSSKFLSFIRRKKHHPKLSMTKVRRKIDPEFSGGMNGFMYISDKTVYSEEVYSPIEDLETIINNNTIFVYYKSLATKTHVPRPPEGVIFPAKSISIRDLQQIKRRFWHETPITPSFGFLRRPVSRNVYAKQSSQISRRPTVSEHLLHRKQPNNGSEQNGRTNNKVILGKRKWSSWKGRGGSGRQKRRN
ncbi:5'-3' exoribonuclease 4 isoform X1 [Dendrobium catenatum]|uniref:5'-3' exoribonuclease n=2 Tax=Dendrobium catenatum TaxID=906689 RepID=A0A2I0VB53_9ASPA|nr:5'-3' exoribonuclease 4 isoform X1 [Dendrobium catenatum]PKU60641.1 5'-3' exoribonuclease 4 [Dendrobium catenatum]